MTDLTSPEIISLKTLKVALEVPLEVTAVT
jgi:hypothetical protein